jgi:hypothetical protein
MMCFHETDNDTGARCFLSSHVSDAVSQLFASVSVLIKTFRKLFFVLFSVAVYEQGAFELCDIDHSVVQVQAMRACPTLFRSSQRSVGVSGVMHRKCWKLHWQSVRKKM